MTPNVVNPVDSANSSSIAAALAKTLMADEVESPSLAKGANGDSDAPSCNASGDKARIPSEPVQFLEWLRPVGPWPLTAIEPDGGTITITAMAAQAVDEFVRRHNGKRNIYYSVNRTRKADGQESGKDRHRPN
jgi:hypothetical protein